MSDQSAFINAYIDVAVDSVHAYLNEIMQLRTNLKLANDIISQKDKQIVDLQAQQETDQNNLSELAKIRDNARQWEERYHSMSNRTAHMDTLTTQFNQLKQDFIKKTEECERLAKEIEELKNPKLTKKVINKKDTKSAPVIAYASNTTLKVDSSSNQNENDDF